MAIMSEPLLPREFQGGRLRRLFPRDRAAFQAYRAIPEIGRYQGWSPMSDAEARDFVDEMNRAPLFVPGQWVQFAIATPESDELVGDIGLFVSEDGTFAEIGFTLEPRSQGFGLASAAVREALQLLFSATSVMRVLGIADDRNRRSIKLLERVGFEFIERRQAVFKGEPCTESVYGLARRG